MGPLRGHPLRLPQPPAQVRDGGELQQLLPGEEADERHQEPGGEPHHPLRNRV